MHKLIKLTDVQIHPH